MLIQYAKELAKSRLSPGQLDSVRRVRGWAQNLRLPVVSARLVTSFGPRAAAETKERISVTGRLDYQRADIYLTLDSAPSLVRLRGCSKEPDTVAWLERTFRAGDVLYDVGANVGAYSFVANAIAGGKCLVYAFEPSPATFSNLSQNILLNGCSENVVGFQVALSDQTGLVCFHYSNLASGASMHGGIDQVSFDGQSAALRARHVQTLMAYRLDEFISLFGLKPPTHIKLDVDGPELAVLAGGPQTLGSAQLRTVLVEVDEVRYPNQEIERTLAEHGFRVTERYPRITPGAFNYIFER